MRKYHLGLSLEMSQNISQFLIKHERQRQRLDINAWLLKAEGNFNMQIYAFEGV